MGALSNKSLSAARELPQLRRGNNAFMLGAANHKRGIVLHRIFLHKHANDWYAKVCWKGENPHIFALICGSVKSSGLHSTVTAIILVRIKVQDGNCAARATVGFCLLKEKEELQILHNEPALCEPGIG